MGGYIRKACRYFMLLSSMFFIEALETPASAWDGYATGIISSIEETTTPYQTRITLVGAPALCGNGNPWAYMSTSYDNYQATVALLISRFSTGKPVTVYSNRDTVGYCQIGSVQAYSN